MLVRPLFDFRIYDITPLSTTTHHSNGCSSIQPASGRDLIRVIFCFIICADPFLYPHARRGLRVQPARDRPRRQWRLVCTRAARRHRLPARSVPADAASVPARSDALLAPGGRPLHGRLGRPFIIGIVGPVRLHKCGLPSLAGGFASVVASFSPSRGLYRRRVVGALRRSLCPHSPLRAHRTRTGGKTPFLYFVIYLFVFTFIFVRYLRYHCSQERR